MMAKFSKLLNNNPRNLFIVGLLLTLIITLIAVTRDRHMNFVIFANSTLDFWRDVSPYTMQWVEDQGRFFLYSPVFSVLFTPLALLPKWLGAFAWNLFNYTIFFFAIFTLPAKYTTQQKCHTFLFLLLILGQSLLEFQYNITVASIFLFTYSLLERNKYLYAVLLIAISGLTKIYGIFQLGLLLCYPRFWHNISYCFLFLVILSLLPLFNFSPYEMFYYYGEWLNILDMHQTNQSFDSFFHIGFITDYIRPHFRLLQGSMFAVLILLFTLNKNKYSSFAFRAQSLGILMGWIVLFSDSAEKHTYIIALAGYMLWYMNHTPRTIDKILMWLNFGLMCVAPIDVICPVSVMKFICNTLWLNILVFSFTWLRMVYITLRSETEQSEPDLVH